MIIWRLLNSCSSLISATIRKKKVINTSLRDGWFYFTCMSKSITTEAKARPEAKYIEELCLLDHLSKACSGDFLFHFLFSKWLFFMDFTPCIQNLLIFPFLCIHHLPLQCLPLKKKKIQPWTTTTPNPPAQIWYCLQ